MTTDKTPATLATVKHGGCVQLPTSERARFEAFLSGNPLMGLMAGTAWQVWQAALSAQPSPGGQGDALLEQVARFLDYSTGHDPWPNIRRVYGDSWWEPVNKMRDELRALAARQPVCATVKDSLTVGGGLPVGRIVGYMDPEEDFILPTIDSPVVMGKITLFRSPADKWTKPLYDGPPAQAVDLGSLDDIASDLHQSSLSDDYEPDQIVFLEAIYKRLRALIDSQAVGNGH
ncbi:hypothetical protein ABE494_06395 [Stenotrophomonas lactitubi]|uniref:hypothetical protein n=1 Tax=Stenotrophomonas lactitubi TaxID=2045214 RepID=UPI00203C10AE|nr:hypothetical protein [Stenotrophomonas lactitubi]